MNNRILVINCGSSSLKFALMEPEHGRNLINGIAERLGTAEAQLVWRREGDKNIQPIPQAKHKEAMQAIIDVMSAQELLAEPLAAVGHRVVHGGEAFTASTIIQADVLAAIEACNHLAPLHNPANVIGIRTAMALFPNVPQVAVFDTAFHQTLPPHAYLYPVPYDLYLEQGVRRYGFHGTSHRYVTEQAAERLQRPYHSSRFLSAHLGNGCSAAAVANGQSVDTTMGLTPLEGLMMGTRSGDVDPSLHQYLHNTLGYNIDRVTQMLNKESGLLGISQLSNDMRTLEDAADEGHELAALAIEIFCYRLAKSLAGLAVPLGQVDALIFTGGIGENSPLVRQKTLQHLRLLGYEIDDGRNQVNGRDTDGIITTENSPIAIVIPTNEELMIAKDSLSLVQKEHQAGE